MLNHYKCIDLAFFCDNNITPAYGFSRENDYKKVKKSCSNYLTFEGIVDGNDSYLYGEKIKAYLIRGAKRDIGGFTEFPNAQLGWGSLCVADSIPRG